MHARFRKRKVEGNSVKLRATHKSNIRHSIISTFGRRMVIATTKAELKGKCNCTNGKIHSELNPVGNQQRQFDGVNEALF